jgi:hypothetical protein
MTQKYRCDSCKKIFSKNDLTKIIDEKGRSWCRCRDCVRKHGKKPFSLGYYAYLQFDGVMGMEDPKKIVGYGPCDCKND